MATWTDRINEMLSSLEAAGANNAAPGRAAMPSRFLTGAGGVAPAPASQAAATARPVAAVSEKDPNEIGSVDEIQTRNIGPAGILHDLTADQLIQGIILSEVLGKPLALRKNRRI